MLTREHIEQVWRQILVDTLDGLDEETIDREAKKELHAAEVDQLLDELQVSSPRERVGWANQDYFDMCEVVELANLPITFIACGNCGVELTLAIVWPEDSGFRYNSYGIESAIVREIALSEDEIRTVHRCSHCWDQLVRTIYQ